MSLHLTVRTSDNTGSRRHSALRLPVSQRLGLGINTETVTEEQLPLYVSSIQSTKGLQQIEFLKSKHKAKFNLTLDSQAEAVPRIVYTLLVTRPLRLKIKVTTERLRELVRLTV